MTLREDHIIVHPYRSEYAEHSRAVWPDCGLVGLGIRWLLSGVLGVREFQDISRLEHFDNEELVPLCREVPMAVPRAGRGFR